MVRGCGGRHSLSLSHGDGGVGGTVLVNRSSDARGLFRITIEYGDVTLGMERKISRLNAPLVSTGFNHLYSRIAT